jgi:hypothetical protein
MPGSLSSSNRRRGITVLSLVLLIIAVVIAVILLVHYLGHRSAATRPPARSLRGIISSAA